MKDKKTIKKQILNAMTKQKNWDVFREYYPILSLEDRIELCSEWDAYFPNQAHFSLKPIVELFTDAKSILGELAVVELGCHQGQLAGEILSRFDITSWVGYDLNPSALARSLVKDKRYSMVALSDWFYRADLPDFNVFVSTHTFEHMDLEEIEKTVAHVAPQTEYMILEIPITEEGQDWKGYRGSHILTSGRQTIRDLLIRHGFNQTVDISTGRLGRKWVTGWKKLTRSNK